MTVVETTRRAEILETAASLFASSGIRSSLKDIADACGIMPGSLYHHFESKEAIVVELAERYVAALDGVAAAAMHAPSADPIAAIVELGTAIAGCAVRHRAALLLTYYEPPTVYGRALAELAARAPIAIEAAMSHQLDRAAADDLLRPGIDRSSLADWLCQSMLHVGIGAFHRTRAAQQVPAVKCRMLLEGLTDRGPDDAELDGSPARRAADAVIRAWPPRDRGGAHSTHILDVARVEFGRRGYDATTIRDVARAAGVSPRAVYRVATSKEELLMAILRTYVESVTDGWDAVLSAAASPIEKLDALVWLDVNLLERFSEEHKIQSVSLQFAPPSSPNPGMSFAVQLRQVRALLAAADRRGELRTFAATTDVRARCVFSLLWTPENIIAALGVNDALHFGRETILRGAATPTGVSGP